MYGEQLKGHLDLLLLAVLRAGPTHGYGVIASLREGSEGTFDLPEGTVYPALHRLESAGLLRSYWTDMLGRRRRVYELTAAGIRVLADRRSQWGRFAAGMRAVLGGAS